MPRKKWSALDILTWITVFGVLAFVIPMATERWITTNQLDWLVSLIGLLATLIFGIVVFIGVYRRHRTTS